MTNSGLTNRLRQQSRRTGFAVGVAMAVTILLCVGGFVVIYAQVDPLTRDFIGAPPTATATAESGSSQNQAGNQGSQPPATSTPAPTATSAPTSTPDVFTPTHLSNLTDSVNFRAGPGTDFNIIRTLPGGTQLRATGESGIAGDGLTWLEFETEDGTVGWIREIDSVPQG